MIDDGAKRVAKERQHTCESYILILSILSVFLFAGNSEYPNPSTRLKWPSICAFRFRDNSIVIFEEETNSDITVSRRMRDSLLLSAAFSPSVRPLKEWEEKSEAATRDREHLVSPASGVTVGSSDHISCLICIHSLDSNAICDLRSCFNLHTRSEATARTKSMKSSTSMNTSTHGFLCTDTCAHAETTLCPIPFAGYPGALWWAVSMYGGPCDVAAAREAPGRTNKRTKTSVWNSGGMAVYPAARGNSSSSKHCWGKNKSQNN